MDLEEFIKRIEGVEKNLDRVLKATRLGRYERKPMGEEQITRICNYMIDALAMVMGFAALFMVIYFAGR